MTEEGILSASQDGCRCPIDWGWGEVADGVYTVMGPDQLTAGDPTIDRIIAETAGPKLCPRGETVLAPRESRNSAINLAHGPGKDEKAAICADILTLPASLRGSNGAPQLCRSFSAVSMKGCNASGLASDSRLAAWSAGVPIRMRLTGTSSTLPDSVRGTSAIWRISSGT